MVMDEKCENGMNERENMIKTYESGIWCHFSTFQVQAHSDKGKIIEFNNYVLIM